MRFFAPTSLPAVRISRARTLRVAAVVLLAGSLAACGSTSDDRTGRAFWQPYRPNVQQGNWVTAQQVALLRPGMTREQVQFALGTPTLTPLFHADRWEYPYFLKPGYGETQSRLFTVYFRDNLLERWDGDHMPSHQPFQSPAPLEAQEKRELLDQGLPTAGPGPADDGTILELNPAFPPGSQGSTTP